MMLCAHWSDSTAHTEASPGPISVTRRPAIGVWPAYIREHWLGCPGLQLSNSPRGEQHYQSRKLGFCMNGVSSKLQSSSPSNPIRHKGSLAQPQSLCLLFLSRVGVPKTHECAHIWAHPPAWNKGRSRVPFYELGVIWHTCPGSSGTIPEKKLPADCWWACPRPQQQYYGLENSPHVTWAVDEAL